MIFEPRVTDLGTEFNHPGDLIWMLVTHSYSMLTPHIRNDHLRYHEPTNLSPWMHVQVLIFPKNICDGFDGKTSSYMGESENFLHQGNPYLLERPLIRQF